MDTLLAPVAAEISTILSEGGPQALLAGASLNTHEGVFSVKETDLEGGAGTETLRSLMTSRKGLTDIPLEIYIWIPGFTAAGGKEEALSLLASHDIWGGGYPPCLEEDSYEAMEITMSTGEVVTIDPYEEQEFPIVVIDRAESEYFGDSAFLKTSGSITVTMYNLKSYWPNEGHPNNIDPLWREQPEFYCCSRPDGTTTWGIYSGTDPWGGINHAGTVYSIGLAVFEHLEDTVFEIQFRDMDGLTPKPSKTNANGLVDDSIGGMEIDSSDLTATSPGTLFLTDTDIADDNAYTTISTSYTYFRIYK